MSSNLSQPIALQIVAKLYSTTVGFSAPMNPHGDDYISHNALIFVYTPTDGMYQGKHFSGKVTEVGTHTHRGRTLQAYK